MNRTFKIIGRDKRTGKQIKKRTYVSIDKFEKYAPELLDRYSRLYNVKAYELIGNNWLKMESHYIICPKCKGAVTEKICNHNIKYRQEKVDGSEYCKICNKLYIYNCQYCNKTGKLIRF